MFDLTIAAFNASERLRMPVFVMADEIVGHMTERVIIPAPEDITVVERKRTPVGGDGRLHYEPDEDLVPPMPIAGEGHNVHVTGLTHDERGYPAGDATVHDRLLRRASHNVQLHPEELDLVEEVMTEDGELLRRC